MAPAHEPFRLSYFIVLLSINFKSIINSFSKYSGLRLSKDKVDKAEIISTFPLLTPKFVSIPHKATKISLSTLNLALTFSSRVEFSFKRIFAVCILFSSTLFSKYS